MAGGDWRKTSAASARSNTGRNNKNTTSVQLSLIVIVQIAVAVVGIVVGWAYVTLKPPPAKVCGLPGGPPVTSPRVKLSDGRHLAYREVGVSKEEANFKIILVHGLNSSKDINLPISQELIENLRIYILLYDRAGYTDSDPHPKRSVKSEAFDIQELADKLQIGTKFYVVGLSIGAYPVWSCLKYIPHRLSGAALVGPFVNYWWPCFPASLAEEAFKSQLVQDQWTFRVAHYAPNWLFNWWKTQKWIPSLGVMEGNRAVFSSSDIDLLNKFSETPQIGQEKTLQQGAYESVFRDIMAGFGKWEFDPLDLINPFPNNESSIHLWQGLDDKIISFKLTRFLSQKLPWIRYHEVPNAGHLLILDSILCEAIIKALLIGSTG